MSAGDFTAWLAGVDNKYTQLNDSERNETLDRLIDKSEASQLYHLYKKLNSLLKRDFLVLLPREISFRLLFYLDVRSLLTCCKVSNSWLSIVSSCDERWLLACKDNGFIPRGSQSNFKELWQKSCAVIQGLRTRDALEEVILFGHTDRVMAIYYNNGIIATGSDDHCVRLWNCDTGDCIKIFQTHTVADLKFDSEKLVTGSFDTTAASWDLSSGQLMQRFQGHVAAVFSIDYVDDFLLTGSADSTVRIWNLESGSILKVLSQHRSAWITGVKLKKLTDNSFLILSRDNTAVHSWIMDKSMELSITDHRESSTTFSDLIPGLHTNKNNHIMYSGFSTESGKCSVVDVNLSGEMSHSGDYVFLPGSQLQSFLGCGAQFDVFLVEESERCPRLDIMNKSNCVASVNICSLYRGSKRGSTFTLGEMGWLDGFTGENDKGVLFAASLKDNSVYLLKWKDNIEQN